MLRNANLSDQFEFQKRLWEDRAAYIDQLVFINRRIEHAIDRLIADSRRPPVILLLSRTTDRTCDAGCDPVEQLPDPSRPTFPPCCLPGAPAALLPEE